MSKEPEWDRRKEDAEMRADLLKTLGAVQSSIHLFETAIHEHKVQTERQILRLERKVNDHSLTLDGSSMSDGIHQQLRELRREVNKLMAGVLGEGANYEKSLKGQVESLNGRIGTLQAAQIRDELDESNADKNTGHLVAIRGQNILSRNQVVAVLGVVLAALIAAFGRDLMGRAWRWYSNPPPVEVPKGKPTPPPRGFNKKAKPRPRPAAAPVAQQDQASDPIRPPRAPLASEEGSTPLRVGS